MPSWIDWKAIDSKYPTKLDKEALSEAEFRKQRTVELYSFLPQTSLEERQKYIDIRDAVIELNYTFFGYVASHKFLNNSYISYEDKFQSAVLHFCTMWAKFKYAAKYRTDLSFAVFFKPRITECMEREHDEVKYSLRRSLCMEVGNQLGIHWAKVTYDDLSNPKLHISADKMASLKAAFGSLYVAELETHAMFIPDESQHSDINELYNDNYNSLTDMLIHEMIEQERELDQKDLLRLAEMLDVPVTKLENLVDEAKEKLHATLLDRIAIQETFN